MNKTKIKLLLLVTLILCVLLLGTLAVLMITGILLHPLHGVLIVLILHKLSAVLFVFGLIAHVVQHRNFFSPFES